MHEQLNKYVLVVWCTNKYVKTRKINMYVLFVKFKRGKKNSQLCINHNINMQQLSDYTLQFLI